MTLRDRRRRAASRRPVRSPRRLGPRTTLGLRFEGGLPEGLVARLAAEGVHVSVRGDRLRITPHLYDDAHDLARLMGALGRSLGR
jgi:hypothetical protein